jgi:hypothetical protein
MKRLVPAILAIISSLAANSALAYPSATVFNNAPVPANVTVRYAACRSDSFTVPARNLKDGAGRATSPVNRGACLITGVEATFTGKSWTARPYSSKGTSFSQFLIWYDGSGVYTITESHDMTSDRWENMKDQDSSPDGALGNTLSNRQAMGDNPLPKCQADNQSSIAQLEARIDGAPPGKLSKAQKDRFQSIRNSLKPIPGQKGTIENCNKKTQTIAAWKAEVDQALGTTR